MTQFTQLLANAQAVPYEFPVEQNRIHTVTQAPFHYDPTEIGQMAASTRLIVAEEVIQLAEDFLAARRANGSSIEKSLYREMTLSQLFDKLIRKRPLMFMNPGDDYTLRDGATGGGGFDEIGTEAEETPLVLAEYNSYPEMQIAALMGISSPTFFINEGGRFNKGMHGEPGTFEEKGIYVGLVGARFERQGLMEWQYMIVDPQQNTAENGYGANADPNSIAYKALLPWAKFYQQGEHFSAYKTARQDTTGRFLEFGGGDDEPFYLDTQVYQRRMYMLAKAFLLEANDRAKAAKTSAYVIAVGYGIGVWAINELKDQQAQIILQAFSQVIEEHALSNISDLCFSWYPASAEAQAPVGNGETLHANGNTIRLHFNKDNPMKKLEGEHAGKLLVASFAWDGNSYIGNEYWQGSLSASGDPAAVCCSLISELQNPDVNPAVNGENVWVAKRGE